MREPEIGCLGSCLRKLLRHASAEKLALTGSVAMQLGVTQERARRIRASVADLDFVVSDPDAIDRAAAAEFLISHRHVVQPGVPRFFLQLVDSDSRMRIDIFPDLLGTVDRARTTRIDGLPLRVLSLEHIFEHKLLTLSGASPSRPVDPKHDRDARMLGSVLGRQVPTVPASSLVNDVYGTDANAVCRRCELSRSTWFPIAPKGEILGVLGYV